MINSYLVHLFCRSRSFPADGARHNTYLEPGLFCRLPLASPPPARPPSPLASPPSARPRLGHSPLVDHRVSEAVFLAVDVHFILVLILRSKGCPVLAWAICCYFRSESKRLSRRILFSGQQHGGYNSNRSCVILEGEVIRFRHGEEERLVKDAAVEIIMRNRRS